MLEIQNEQKTVNRNSRKLIVGVNDLASQFPDIAAEWHPTKNGLLTPCGVYKGSAIKAYWLCSKSHEYMARIADRTKDHTGCPYCAGRKVLPGYNDLLTINPNIAKEWHPTKNGDLTPSQVTIGSHKEVCWLCERGHTYKCSVKCRTLDHYGCPYCSGNRVLVGFNDLETIAPDIAKEWHPTKNGELMPTNVSKCCNRKVWWRCPLGHDYQAAVADRTRGHATNNCPYCSGRRILIGFNDLETVAPDIAKEWHSTKNGSLRPCDVTRCSMRKVWWRCPLGHDYQATVAARTFNNNSCPYCSGNKVLVGFNDLETVAPDIAKEWHSTKNGSLHPIDVTRCSMRKVWWQCPLGHEYQATVAARTSDNSCPYCSGHRVLIGFNDLTTLAPEIASEWHPILNDGKRPSDFSPGSREKVWWLCPNKHEYYTSINSRAGSKRSGCPYCARKITPPEDYLSVKYPELFKELDETANYGLCDVKTLSVSYQELVWWKCPHNSNHRYAMTPYNKVTYFLRGRESCPYCKGYRRTTNYNI